MAKGRGKHHVPHHLFTSGLPSWLHGSRFRGGEALGRAVPAEIKPVFTPGPSLSHRGAQTLPLLLPLPEPTPEGLMLLITPKSPAQIFSWGGGSGYDSLEQGVKATPKPGGASWTQKLQIQRNAQGLGLHSPVPGGTVWSSGKMSWVQCQGWRGN